MMRKPIAVQALALLAMLTPADAQQPEITRYPLASNVTYPEGIAYDPKDGNIYTGSAATGLIFRMVPQVPSTKVGTIVAPEGAVLPGDPFPALLGMKVDGANRLWVAGGRTGKMAVVSTIRGNVLKRFDTPAEPAGLINDVVVTSSGAYFTDTLRPTLWRVPVEGDHIGELEPWLQFQGSPLEYTEGANLNGIAATPDGRNLIVVQMNKGLLFRISVADKRVTPIDTGGEALNTADGLVLDGRRLYV
ncbi:MAG: SMP-30/gluconolactonase/LRE family protein, partial [Vicinamibacterales bacterium]